MVDEIGLLEIGKRFNGRWLFRHVEASWFKGDRIAIIGANGSGKSSLSGIIAGYLTPTEGSVVFKNKGNALDQSVYWKNISWTSPALHIPEPLSYLELFVQIERMRGFNSDWSIDKMEALMGLEKYRHQPIKSFSSGMRQRVKLILAFAVNAEILLLDEPTAHLDKNGVDWFSELIKGARHNFIFVASNSNDEETFLCNKVLNVSTCAPV